MKHVSTRTVSLFLLASAFAVSGTAFADSKDRSASKKVEPAHVESYERSGSKGASNKVEPAHVESYERSGSKSVSNKVEPAHVESNERSGGKGASNKVEPAHVESYEKSSKVPGVTPPPVKQEVPHTEPAHSSNPNELRVRLADAAATVSADAEFETKTTKTEFEGNVRVNQLNSYGINDKASATAAQVTLTLTHPADATPYAECTLALRSFKQNFQGFASASYRVVSTTNQIGTVFEAPVGAACDNLGETPITATPAVTAGDSVSLSINGTPVAAGTIQ